MKKTERGSLLASVSIGATLIIVALLGFIFWQNFLQAKDTSVHEPIVEDRIVTSTLKDWSVSLRAPSDWNVEVKDDAWYNYDTRQKEAGQNTIVTHPSGKVQIHIRHMPFFSADGACGANTIEYLNKEAVGAINLIYVEAVAPNGSIFLGLTNITSASAITEQFNSCFMYRDLINQEAKNVLSPEDPIPSFKVPYVSVRITPNLASDHEERSSTSQKSLDFLKSKEYLEAKEIVRSFRF